MKYLIQGFNPTDRLLFTESATTDAGREEVLAWARELGAVRVEVYSLNYSLELTP